MSSAFGQILTWTNQSATTPGGGNFGRSTNWSGDNGAGGLTPITGSIETFDGTVAGPLRVFSQDGINGAGSGNVIGGGFGANGFTLHLTPTQTGSLLFYSPIAGSIGMGLNAIQLDAGAGQLTLGDNTINQLVAVFRPASSLHTWINNSANAVIINPNFQIQNGGGAPGHVINFQGTGDWIITNAMRFNNNAPSHDMQWDSTGTTLWVSTGGSGSSGTNLFNSALGNLIINAGTIIVKSAGLLPITPGANTIQHNGALLKIDLVNQSDTIGRTISGIGPVQHSAGTNSFTSINSTFSGPINLSGGEMIAGANEIIGISGPLGQGGTITFNGGILGYSANNAFDYSARFDTAAGQTYRIDTANQSVTYATGLGGAGNSVVKLGGGTLTLAGANSYTGPTTISVGQVTFNGPKTGTGAISLANGTTIGLTEIGTQITPSTLTMGTSADTTAEFNNVTNKTTAPLAAATIASGGTININVNSGKFIFIGDTFPLISWGAGSTPATALGVLGGAAGHLNTNGSSIELVIDVPPFIWTGGNNGSWDTTTTSNWLFSGVPVTWTNGSIALIDDENLLGATALTLSGTITPQSITVNNTTNAFSITSSGGNVIGGSASLTKIGNNTLTLSGGANTYSGVTTMGGGNVSVGVLANGGSPSDIGSSSSLATNVVLNGGTLQYTGTGASINRLFSVGTQSGGIDNQGSGPLTFNSTGTMGLRGSGPRTLTLTGLAGVTNTMTPNITDSAGGGTSLAKSGGSLWVLTGTNTYTGGTTIGGGGVLQIGANGPSGTLGGGAVVNDSAIDFQRTGILTVNGAISGTGSVTNNSNGTNILAGNNSYRGGTTINAGALQVGNGGAAGELYINGPIHNNTLLIFNTTGTHTYTGTGLIDGSGNVMVQGANGMVKALGANSYTGWTLIDTNAGFQPCEGNQGQLLSSVVTNHGVLKLVRQDQGVFYYSNNIVGIGRVLKDVNNQNLSDVTLLGTNSYSGGTIIAGGQIILGEGQPGHGTIVGNIAFTNSPTGQDIPRAVVFNRPEDHTFSGNITGLGGAAVANAGQVIQNGAGLLTLTGNNTYLGGTTVSNGTLQVGNGGTSGSIGTGPVLNNTVITFNRSGSGNFNVLTVPGVISGAGEIRKIGTGMITLSGNNTYTGNTTISNGTLVLSGSVGGDVNINGGNLAAAGFGTVGTLTIQGNLNINSGSVIATVNRLLSPSNSLVRLTNELTLTSGTATAAPGTSLKIVLNGTLPVVGDKYTIFSQPVTGGAGMTMVTPGFTVSNDLAVDGSVTVTATNPAPIIAVSKTGTTLNLSWPATWSGGVHLQAQTNTLTVGLRGNWVTIPGSDLSNLFSTPMNTATNTSVFYRLIAP